MSPATAPCERCQGSGRTPRTRRRTADGSPDPLDIFGRHGEVCDRCSGSGEVPLAPPAAARGPGTDASPTPFQSPAALSGFFVERT